MLPPGHFAAGYLLAKEFTNLTKPLLSQSQLSHLAFWGGFFGFAPDLDMFYAFWKEKGFHHSGEKLNHRAFVTHTPMFWLVVGGLTAYFGGTMFWYCFGSIVVIGAWSHLLLDSTYMGIRWLWPFNKNFYALKSAGVVEPNTATGFFKHWINLLRQYITVAPVTVALEIIIVFTAVLVFLMK